MPAPGQAGLLKSSWGQLQPLQGIPAVPGTGSADPALLPKGAPDPQQPLHWGFCSSPILQSMKPPGFSGS